MSIEEKVSVKILMNMLIYGAKEIAKFDNDFKSKLQGLNEMIHWKIGDDISCYMEVKNGEIDGSEGNPPSDPTLTLEINDAPTALEALSGTQTIEELASKIKSSDAGKALQLGFIIQTVGTYMEGMR